MFKREISSKGLARAIKRALASGNQNGTLYYIEPKNRFIYSKDFGYGYVPLYLYVRNNTRQERERILEEADCIVRSYRYSMTW